jgi:hypothetical protein
MILKILSILIITCTICIKIACAQDFNARVQVLSPKIQATNKRAFTVLETAIKDFINGRKWSNDLISAEERIDCSLIINITEWDGSSNYKAEAQIQSNRPVYNSTYLSPLLNIIDKDFSFNYTEGQIIDYTDQSYQNNLGSLLAFYAYLMLGLDYDSFAPFGGNPYLVKAQVVVTNAQIAAYTGWKSFDSNRNRYWLIENLNDQSNQVIRQFYYDYHRNGLDKMSESISKSLKTISTTIKSLEKLDKQKQGSVFPQVFFTTKADEFIAVLSKVDSREKAEANHILTSLDPSNGTKYQALLRK